MKCLMFFRMMALVTAMSGCGGSNCGALTDEGGCPKRCAEVAARPLVEEEPQPCWGKRELLGCMEKGNQTSDDACVVSPTGTIYMLGGSQAAWLVINEGYTNCVSGQQGTYDGCE